MRKIRNCILFCFVVLYSIQGKTQFSQVDSVLTLLKAAPKKGRVDTVLIKSINQILDRTQLTDEDVKNLVKEAALFKTGDDEDMSIQISNMILRRLSSIDLNKSIDFGIQLVERVSKSNTPEKNSFIYLLLLGMRNTYRNSNRLAEGIQYYNAQLIKFKEVNDSSGIAVSSFVLSGFYRTIGLFDRAIYMTKKSLSYLDSSQYYPRTYFGLIKYGGRYYWINNLGTLTDTYFNKGDFVNSIKYGRLTLELREKDKNNGRNLNPGSNAYIMQSLGKDYLQINRLDSSLYFIKKAYEDVLLNPVTNVIPVFQAWSLLEIRNKNFEKADSLLVNAWQIIRKKNIPASTPEGIIDPDYYRSLIRIEQNKYAEAADLLLSDISRIKNFRNELIRDYKLLAEVYNKMGDKEKSIVHFQKYITLQDSLLADQSKFRTLSFEAEQQVNEKELAINKLKSDNKISSLTRNFSFGIIALVLMLAGLVYYRYRSKEKANAILQKTLADLQSTQTQLIQSEKMASLGELTAGIAHEIQNPLNFVNNFSEINNELLGELKAERLKPSAERNEAVENELIDDVISNEQKINHHGKRADAIVKGMLQHSRSSSGVKEPTDINALADEYLRLAYHGLRAKDKSFNATMQTDFDSHVGNINVISQDIGRVILNLITNAFYAVTDRRKLNEPGYEPTVSVKTQKQPDKVLITVKDNGMGIPEQVKEKIFQPFFTTKPTGQGTGLGLSMSYDIVTKGHAGQLTVNTQEGIFTEFTIVLPIQIT